MTQIKFSELVRIGPDIYLVSNGTHHRSLIDAQAEYPDASWYIDDETRWWLDRNSNAWIAHMDLRLVQSARFHRSENGDVDSVEFDL